MTECDTLLMIGSGFPYSEFLPKEGQARGVQIDIAPDMLSLRYPMEVNLVGDAAETLRALLPLLQQKTDRAWRDDDRGAMSRTGGRRWKSARMQTANPVNPQRVAWELSPRLPDRAIITSDSGSCANWYARDLKMRRGMMASLSGGLASMGAAVPYAIAAKFAHPDRPVIALVGDGAMQMNNMAELITVAKYWRDWAEPAAGSSASSTTRTSTRSPGSSGCMEGDPKFDASQQIPNVPYHRFAELIGLKGSMSTIPSGSARPGTRRSPPTGRWCSKSRPTRTCRRCRRTSRSTQAKKFTATLVKGDPDEGGVIVRHREAGAELGACLATRTRTASRCRSRAPIAQSRRRLPHSDRRAGGGRHLRWDATTLVVVAVEAGGETGLGYTYADAGVAR